MIDEKKVEFFEKIRRKHEIIKDEITIKFESLLNQYRERFDDNAPTEPSTFSKEKWCEILEECLEKNISVEEMYGMDYDNEIY